MNPQNCGTRNLIVFEDFHWGHLGIVKKMSFKCNPTWISKNTIGKKMVILPKFKLFDVFCEFELACGLSMHHVGSNDALPSHGVKPTWGFHKVKLRKVETWRHAPDFQL
jgi:hypothetical protein